MGSRWTVLLWWVNPSPHGYDQWVVQYAGQSAWQAFRAARKAKRTSGAVKVEWR